MVRAEPSEICQLPDSKFQNQFKKIKKQGVIFGNK